jgi:hypothetical protein
MANYMKFTVDYYAKDLGKTTELARSRTRKIEDE